MESNERKSLNKDWRQYFLAGGAFFIVFVLSVIILGVFAGFLYLLIHWPVITLFLTIATIFLTRYGERMIPLVRYLQNYYNNLRLQLHRLNMVKDTTYYTKSELLEVEYNKVTRFIRTLFRANQKRKQIKQSLEQRRTIKRLQEQESDIYWFHMSTDMLPFRPASYMHKKVPENPQGLFSL